MKGKTNNWVAKNARKFNRSQVFIDQKKETKFNPTNKLSGNEEAITQGKVRINGGNMRGRTIKFFSYDNLRPTGSRIRETLFNWLSSSIQQARVLDLFAGSGVLGFESMSRGAAKVTMIESDKRVCEQLNTNCRELNIQNIDIVNTTAQHWLKEIGQGGDETIDIAFIDPPFELQIEGEILHTLVQSGILAPGALLYVEHPKNRHELMPPNFIEMRNKTAGNVCYKLLKYRRDGYN